MAVAAKKMECGSEIAGTASQVLVLGMGATGVSCARYLAARGITAAFADTRENPPGSAAIHDLMPAAELFAGNQLTELPDGIERIIVSPGVDLDQPLLQQARGRNIEILSDIDLFVLECRAPIIAITGSNGKSTVTTMLGAMLNAAGRRARVGGNLGAPALDILDPEVDLYVLELSSFQLERSRPVPAAAAVVLNVTPDHLDRHPSFESYVAAKAHIYAQCEAAVLNRDAPELAELIPAEKQVIGFGLGEPGTGDIGLRMTARGEVIACGKELLMPVTELGIAGRHNLANALAALALGLAAGIDPASMLGGLRTFQGLPHRMQRVHTADGIVWIDDSKATNVAAAVMAVRSISAELVLIAGGEAKGAAFDELARALSGRNARAILIGRDRERMAAALKGCCEISLADDLRQAVELARGLAQPGDTVLLAPACGSHDMFRDFAHRGEVFQEAIAGGAE